MAILCSVLLLPCRLNLMLLLAERTTAHVASTLLNGRSENSIAIIAVESESIQVHVTRLLVSLKNFRQSYITRKKAHHLL